MLVAESSSSSPQFADAKGHFHRHQPQREHRNAEHDGQHAEGERRVVGHAELHHRPVDAPHDGEQDEHDELLAGKAMHGGALSG
jgi:hypothetical protein